MIKALRFSLVFFVLNFALSQLVQSQVLDELQSKLSAHELETEQEKVYISFDRNTYIVGDHIWFHVFLLKASDYRPEAKSKFVHVEFFDLATNEVFAKRTVKVVDGMGQADVQSLPTWGENLGVRGYTHHMLNFDEGSQFVGNLNFIKSKSKNKSVASGSKGIDVQFLPESGNLLDGVRTIVAFKGVSEEGRSVHFTGKITKLGTEEIIPLKTQYSGMGRVTITPEFGAQYVAEIDYLGKNYTFQLPQVEKLGYQLNCSFQGKRLMVSTMTLNQSLMGATVVVHQNNQVVFTHDIVSEEVDHFLFDPKELDEAVYQISLFNASGLPLAERMVYLNLDNAEPIAANLNVEVVDGEAKAALELEEGFLGSFSVYDAKYDINPYKTSIKDYLLLNSHVKGIVENPGFYFDRSLPKHVRNFCLDLLMLTQGWSRFDWSSVLAEEEPKGQLPAESDGLNIRLRTFMDYGRGDKRPLQTEVDLVEEDPVQLTKGKTYSNGEIIFNKSFSDTLNLFAKANAVFFNGRQLRESESISIEPYPVTSDFRPQIIGSEKYTAPVIYKESTKRLPYLERALNQIDLKNVTVTEKRKDKRRNGYPPEYFKRPGQVYNPTFVTRRRVVDDNERMMFTNPLEILTQMGISIGLVPRQSEETVPFDSAFDDQSNAGGTSGLPGSGTSGFGRLTGQPLFLLNGVPTDVGYILNISPWEIDFVDTLLGPEAAVYGLRGNNGVIAFYTKTGREAKYNIGAVKNEVSFTFEGYYKSRKFYQTEMNAAGIQNNGLPVPTLAFQTMNTENRSVSFDLNSKDKDLVIKVEGITESGEPFVIKQTLVP